MAGRNPLLVALEKANPQTAPTQQNNQQGNPAQNNMFQQKAMSVINQYGGDGQKAFFAECQRKGIDPTMALQQAQVMFNQMFNK